MLTRLSSSFADSAHAPDARPARARRADRLTSSHVRGLAALALVMCLGGGAGCAGVHADGAGGGGSGGLPARTGGHSGGGGTGGEPLQATGGGNVIVADGGGETTTCDGGDACTCPPFKLAVIGKPGKWGANPNGDPDTALQDWLNSSSAGTAQVDNFKERPTLTPDFLASYSVIILASLGDDSNNGPWWSFSADEIAAFRAWVENGGGVITLSGYSGDPNEVNPANQLIGFSGVKYSGDGVWCACADQATCSCTHSNTLSDWNRSDPVVASLATGMTYVGFDNGRAIVAPADAHVAATAGGGANVLVGKLVAKGRVLAYGDEWVTYTSQWTGAGNPSANDPNCQGHLPQDKYQMAQFWYNLIRWAQPAASCFTIVGPVIIG